MKDSPQEARCKTCTEPLTQEQVRDFEKYCSATCKMADPYEPLDGEDEDEDEEEWMDDYKIGGRSGPPDPFDPDIDEEEE